jgi:MFS transporter, FSR family, fosmidomycin resistance protein
MFVVAHFSHHLMTALPIALIPFIRDGFGLSYTQSAWIISAFSLAYGFSQLPSGWLADRVSRATMIAIGIIGVAGAGILLGFSYTYTLTLVLLVIMGILGGGYHPAATPWVSASAGEKAQGRALGFHFVGGGAGFFVAPLVAAAIAAAWGWQKAFLILAGPSLVFGIIFYLFLRRQMKASQMRAVSAHNADGTAPEKDRWRPLAALLVMSLIGGGMGSVMSFLSLYMVDNFGVSKQWAASLMAFSSFAGLWAGPLGGHISDRLGRLPIMLTTSIIGGILTLSVRFIPNGMTLTPLIFSMGALLFVMGINGYLSAPVSEAFIIRQTSSKNRSTIYGMYYLAGQGGALFAPLMGGLIDHIGFRSTATIAGIVIIAITLICGSVLLNAGEKEKVPQAPEAGT